MTKLKGLLFIIVGSILILIISIGFFHVGKLYFSVKRIKKDGIEGIVTIRHIWRGKCGSGYGNSASFKLKIDSQEREFISSCNVPNDVRVGDKYYIKYLSEDPTQNLVLFDKKVIEIDK